MNYSVYEGDALSGVVGSTDLTVDKKNWIMDELEEFGVKYDD